MTDDADTEDFSKFGFEQLRIEIEATVNKLEQEDLELEQAVETYGRGVELLKFAQERLLEAEQKVELLQIGSTQESSDEINPN
ncbi:MAG: exodeoxyribonuclease VII small subunit [Pseudomonadota bacterium]